MSQATRDLLLENYNTREVFENNFESLCCRYHVTETKPGIAKCGKCAALQQLPACLTTLTAKLMVKLEDFEMKTFTFTGLISLNLTIKSRKKTSPTKTYY